MDVFRLEDGSYSLRPRSRRLSLVPEEPLCEPVSECESCTTGQRDKEPLCQETGRVQRFHCQSQDGTYYSEYYCSTEKFSFDIRILNFERG